MALRSRVSAYCKAARELLLRGTAMRVRAFLLAIIILVTCVAAAPQSDPKAKALDWLTQVGAAATADLTLAQSDLAAANKAITSSQKAIALAREHHDAKS